MFVDKSHDNLSVNHTVFNLLIGLPFIAPPWWVTQSGTTAAYEWLEPEAWSSDRLYTWGEEAGDTNLLDERDVWWEMYMCTNVKLNGRVGAPFFNNRYYSVHVRLLTVLCVVLSITPSRLQTLYFIMFYLLTS